MFHSAGAVKTKYHRAGSFCSRDALLIVLRAGSFCSRDARLIVLRAGVWGGVKDQSASMIGFWPGLLSSLQLPSHYGWGKCERALRPL